MWICGVWKGLTTNKHSFNHICRTPCVLEFEKRLRCHKACNINTIKWWNHSISSPPKCSAWNVSLPEHCCSYPKNYWLLQKNTYIGYSDIVHFSYCSHGFNRFVKGYPYVFPLIPNPQTYLAMCFYFQDTIISILCSYFCGIFLGK